MKRPFKTIARVEPPFPFEAYAHIISPLPVEDGGGFLFSVPDLPGCVSDGRNEAEALANGRDAFLAVVSSLRDLDREIPAPLFRPEDVEVPQVSGRFVTRMPKSLHAKLAARAKSEGVSLNTLVLTLLAEGVGRREQRA